MHWGTCSHASSPPTCLRQPSPQPPARLRMTWQLPPPQLQPQQLPPQKLLPPPPPAAPHLLGAATARHTAPPLMLQLQLPQRKLPSLLMRVPVLLRVRFCNDAGRRPPRPRSCAPAAPSCCSSLSHTCRCIGGGQGQDGCRAVYLARVTPDTPNCSSSHKLMYHYVRRQATPNDKKYDADIVTCARTHKQKIALTCTTTCTHTSTITQKHINTCTHTGTHTSTLACTHMRANTRTHSRHTL